MTACGCSRCCHDIPLQAIRGFAGMSVKTGETPLGSYVLCNQPQDFVTIGI